MRTLIIALASAALILPVQAEAGIFGKKKPKEDFTAALPSPTPPAPPVVANGSIFQPDHGYAALHEGARAAAVGDPVTIVLVERTTATKSSGSQLDSNGSTSLIPPSTGALALFSQSDATLGGRRAFKGEGSAEQSNALSGEISVTVTHVYPNGTMLVQGEKRVTLNRGDEFVQIKGLIRRADVDANNRVLSTRVADARIAYTGKGDVARASRQGWLSRFFQVISPF
ncbi:flagellar basal body L-ring protein FlgH [Sphingomonas sp. CJ99]